MTMSEPKKKGIGAMSRGKVKDELRRVKGANEILLEKLRMNLLFIQDFCLNH